jgi:acyl carrier protein
MLVDQLLCEVESDSGDVAVAYRGNQRWVQSYRPGRLSYDVTNGSVLRDRGVYLIGGGLSGVGFALAKYLAKEFKASLLIVDSAKLPPKEKWKDLTEGRDVDDELIKRTRRAVALEELGAEVRIAGADGPDAARLEAAIAQGVAEFGALNGVIYSVDSGEKTFFKPIRELDPSECERLFNSRIAGLSVLERVLEGRQLDFCLVNSSLSSVIGGVGSLVYSSESLLGDAFVQDHNRRSPINWTSVNWDVWRLEDEADQLTSVSDELARLAILPKEGEEAFRNLLGLAGIDQVVVSTTDLDSRIERHFKGGSQRALIQAANADVGLRRHPRPGLNNPCVAPGSEIEREITAIWEKALGIDGVGVQDNFFELGGDSLVAIQVAAQLKDELSIEVPVVSLYECLTIRSLVEFLRSDELGSIAAAGGDQREVRTLRRKDYQEKRRVRRKETKS